MLVHCHYGTLPHWSTMMRNMEFANVEFSPKASAALDQLTAEVDAGDIVLADAIVVAKVFVRINSDPQAVLETWVPLPGESPSPSVLAERVEGIATGFVVVWEAREGLTAYVHDLGWEPRNPTGDSR